MSAVRQWLETLALGQYAELFESNRIELDILPDLTDQDLEKLGITLGDRKRLLRAIAPIAARTGAETTVVFDAHSASVRPTAVPPRGVKVLFSPEGVIADDVIRDLVDAEPAGRVILVATDDAEVVKDVRRAGARTVPLSSLSPLLG